ncbi:MAG TPA: T9SS type A sorting domain-containing protein [Desulfobacterales bacterium]|nr:T9SS type A sorting domain-containing protein [Desulfobacterales bacterium]
MTTTLTNKKSVGVCLVVISVLMAMGVWPAGAQPSVKLPTDPVTIQVGRFGSSLWRTILSDVPPGYDVINGEYLGWCMNKDASIEAGTSYTVTLYSSYDPSMPSYLFDEDWDKINYILNHKQGSFEDIQTAIWHFFNELDLDNDLPVNFGGRWFPKDIHTVQAIVDDANQYGAGFVPRPGQVMAVICDAGPDVQYISIEIIVPQTFTPVTLSRLVAAKAEEGTVITWTTKSEVDIAGFYVLRSGAKDGEYERLNSSMIKARGQSTVGESYAFVDRFPSSIPSYYALETIGLDGMREQFGPILASVPLPATFELSQNVPNPFNATTRITYRLHEAGRMRLLVYDVLGRPVRVLWDGLQQPGEHEVRWDGRDEQGEPVGSGIYVVRFEAGTHTEMKKATLIR